MTENMSHASPRSTAAARLRTALAKWQPPHRMSVETKWSPRTPDPAMDRTHRATVTIRRDERTRGDTVRVERSWSITVRVAAEPGIEPAEVIRSLDAVAQALRAGIAEAKEAATDRGLDVIA